ncbi:50S ribosomal protein L28 [Patescibacteria group bacterium]|nr:50S ribosomal protein L28 [Patescibacteria group bacterium]MBZ9578530.1 50S ribosomal protein L28 [Patescibacteria group bacterium]
MAKQCAICGKKSRLVWRLVKLRGKYNPTIKRRVYPNLQWVRIPPNVKKESYRKFAGKRILACTKCIKALSKRK